MIKSRYIKHLPEVQRPIFGEGSKMPTGKTTRFLTPSRCHEAIQALAQQAWLRPAKRLKVGEADGEGREVRALSTAEGHR